MTKQSPILVRINGVIYDFASFAERHPGGKQVVEHLHLRDGTIPFENHHRKDQHVLKMLKMYICKDQKLIDKANAEIPPMAPIDKALLRLNREVSHEHLCLSQALRCMLQPILELFAGMYLVVSSTSSWTYWLGFFLIALAANEGLGMGHEFHHQTMFASGKMNRLAATWHGILVYGLHGACVWREHGGHHTHTNIADADPALNVPIIRWRKEQKEEPLGEDNPLLSGLNRAFVIAGGVLVSPIAGFFSGFGYQPLFPWYAEIKDERLVSKWTIIAMISRLVFMIFYVGPLAAIVAPWIGMVVSSYTASVNHFDQPVVLPSEVHQRKWTFARIQLEGEHAFQEPEFPGVGILPEFTLGISSDHQHHHFVPNVHHYNLPEASSKVDNFLQDFGLELKHRTLAEATIDSYSTYSNMPKKGGVADSNKGGTGYGLLSGDDESFERMRSNENDDFLRHIPDPSDFAPANESKISEFSTQPDQRRKTKSHRESLAKLMTDATHLTPDISCVRRMSALVKSEVRGLLH